LNILIVYYYRHEYPPRTATIDHLYSFRRYAGHRCFYLNLAFRKVPGYLKQIDFDLVVYHTQFLSTRWSPPLFAELCQRARPLKGLGRVRAALPQDEFIHTDILCDFLREFEVGLIFSVAFASEWPKIYAPLERAGLGFRTVLTGYLDERTVRRIRKLERRAPVRDIDIGYRAWHAAPWLGRHGQLKVRVAEELRAAAQGAGLRLDLSTGEGDTLLGDEWYRFLLRCRYTVGAEGGASILDRDGAIKERTERYLAEHPGAGFEEVEAACFPELDGFLNLMALSPRHLEACVTRTCQVLVEGEYNGVLEAGRHYIELRRDFSNVGEVVELLRDEGLRERIVELAYREVVESGRYSYGRFVEYVLRESLGSAVGEGEGARVGSWLLSVAAFWLMWLADSFDWLYQSRIFPITSRLQLKARVRFHLARVLPEAVLVWLRRVRRAKGA
jgi:hypothetical protein